LNRAKGDPYGIENRSAFPVLDAIASAKTHQKADESPPCFPCITWFSKAACAFGRLFVAAAHPAASQNPAIRSGYSPALPLS